VTEREMVVEMVVELERAREGLRMQLAGVENQLHVLKRLMQKMVGANKTTAEPKPESESEPEPESESGPEPAPASPSTPYPSWVSPRKPLPTMSSPTPTCYASNHPHKHPNPTTEAAWRHTSSKW
jgi:hypothetical protein